MNQTQLHPSPDVGRYVTEEIAPSGISDLDHLYIHLPHGKKTAVLDLIMQLQWAPYDFRLDETPKEWVLRLRDHGFVFQHLKRVHVRKIIRCVWLDVKAHCGRTQARPLGTVHVYLTDVGRKRP